MDITGNIPKVVVPQQKAAPKAEVPLPKQAAPAPAQPAPAPAPVVDNSVRENERARFEKIRQAIAALKDYYPISDSRSVSFKDASGTIVTKVTSLRDGKVTYLPEIALLKRASTVDPSIGAIQANIDTSV